MRYKKKKYKKKHRLRKLLLFLLAILLLIIALFFICKINKIEVTGNERNSDEKIIASIFTDKYDYQTLYFYLKSKMGIKKEIPFIEKYDIEMKSLSSVKIIVYEKSLIAGIEYMGSYMYFDRDGYVADSTQTPLEGIPIVTGLDYEYIILNENLPIDNKMVFDTLLNITQMLTKYEIKVDKIDISTNLDLCLYMGNVKIELGTQDKLNEKISNLKDFVDKLEGASGTLHMKEYNENGKYTFTKEAVQ